MEATTSTTTKQRRPRMAKGTLVTSTNPKTRNTIKLFNSLNVAIVTHFNAISYTSYGYKFAKL